MTQPSFLCDGCAKQFNGVALLKILPSSSETAPLVNHFCSVPCAKLWLETMPNLTAKGLVEVAPVRPETGQHG